MTKSRNFGTSPDSHHQGYNINIKKKKTIKENVQNIFNYEELQLLPVPTQISNRKYFYQ